MSEIGGIIVPLITPMKADESINREELKHQVNRLIEAGVHGIFAFGTNGEGYCLSTEEKEIVLSIVVEETAGRVPVYAGSGCISTKETIALSLRAKELGADVLSIITPSFAQASAEELYDHYSTIAKSVDMPIVLYNIPARTGNALALDTVKRLSELKNIVGIKDSSGNFDYMLQCVEATKKKDFHVLSGNDSLIYWNLQAGGCGAVAGCANVFPKTITGIYERYMKGDMEGARALQESIRPFRNCFSYSNPNTIVKMAVNYLGYPVGSCRRPFHLISEQGQRAVREAIDGCLLAGLS